MRSQLQKGAKRDLTPIFGVPVTRGATPVMGVPTSGERPAPQQSHAAAVAPASRAAAPRRDETPIRGTPIPRRTGTPVHGTPITPPAQPAAQPPAQPAAQPQSAAQAQAQAHAQTPAPKREGTPIRGVPVMPPTPTPTPTPTPRATPAPTPAAKAPTREPAAPDLIHFDDDEDRTVLDQPVILQAPVLPAGAPAGRARPKPPPPPAAALTGANTRVAPAVPPPPPLPTGTMPVVTFRSGASEAPAAPRSLDLDDLFGDIGDLPRATHAMAPINLEEQIETKTASDLIDVGKYEEALTAYEEQLRRNPTDRPARAGKELAFGLKLAAAGDKQGAIQHLEAALEIEPWSERTARALNGIRRAQVDTRKGLLAKLLGRGGA